MEFPWLAQLGCGCQVTRLPVVGQQPTVHWDPCGTHMVAAATGARLEGWPPRIVEAREPVTAR